MPFTVAHAAVAPPLWRLTAGRLPVSALVIGAMAPDLEYLFFLQTRRTVGHSPLGLFAFCLPVSLALLLLWHRLIKRPLGKLVPHRWAHLGAALDRPFLVDSWAARTQTCLAVLVGAVSHIAWDAFTHVDGVGVAAVPQLRRALPLVGLPVYSVLQYGGGVFGMMVLIVAVARWAQSQPRRPVELPSVRHRVVAVAGIASFALAVATVNVARISAEGRPQARMLLVAGILGAMTGTTVAVVAYAMAFTNTRAADRGEQ